MRDATDLFSPYRMGAVLLSNRVVMAPLTRCRAEAGDVLGPMNVAYYVQRAGAGLIISEGVPISPQGKGHPFVPGLFNDAQERGWRAVIEAVHAQGGKIAAQLWHVGRISHPDLQPGGALPVGPSAVRPQGKAMTEAGRLEMVTPRALEISEIPGIIDDYKRAAERAMRAGFDAIEIHGANGYLLDQFLRDGANKRTDGYGGSIENRARLMIEVMTAVAGVAGKDRVGVRISPISNVNDLIDSNPEPLFLYLVKRLDALGLAFIHVVEGITGGPREVEGGFDLGQLRRLFRGTYIANNGYTRDMALAARRTDAADLIAFGKAFISNPDLVERLRRDAPLAAWDMASFYLGGAKGYIDYPALG